MRAGRALQTLLSYTPWVSPRVIRCSEWRPSVGEEEAQKLVERSLDMIQHGNPVGIVGWTDSQSNGFFDKSPEFPFETLHHLAFFHATEGVVEKAINVIRSLVLISEQHLGSSHPITIAAYLDLSSLLSKSDATKAPVNFSKRACQRLRIYLIEKEANYFDFALKHSNNDDDDFKSRMKIISMLRSFVIYMRYLNQRRIYALINSNHPMRLLFLCFLGDCTAVLASCLKFESTLHDNIDGIEFLNESDSLWALAGSYYRMALKGWTRVFGMYHPNVPATACNLARCLHEVGNTTEAIKFLSTTVASLQSLPIKSNPEDSAQMSTLMQYPPNVGKNSSVLNTEKQLIFEHSLGLCQWSIAVYILRNNPNEEGRTKAIEYLHRAIPKLRQRVQNMYNNINIPNEKKIEVLIIMMENELKGLCDVGLKIPTIPASASMKDQRAAYASV